MIVVVFKHAFAPTQYRIKTQQSLKWIERFVHMFSIITKKLHKLKTSVKAFSIYGERLIIHTNHKKTSRSEAFQLHL